MAIALSARGCIFSSSGQPFFAIRKRDSRSKEAVWSCVSRRHSISASPTELVAEGGAADIEARPIWARYHAICSGVSSLAWAMPGVNSAAARAREEIEDSLIMPGMLIRSEEHTSELQSLMRISYAVFSL